MMKLLVKTGVIILAFSLRLYPYTITNTAKIEYNGFATTTNSVHTSYWKKGSLTGSIKDTLSNEELLNVNVFLNGSSSTGSNIYWAWKPIWQDNEKCEFKAEKDGYYEKTKKVLLSSSTTTMDFFLCPKKRALSNYTWRIVSFPVEPSGDSILGTDTLIAGDDLGRTNQHNWRTYIWDEGAEDDPFLSKYINPATITSGLGYWFKYYNPGTIALFTQGTPTPGTYTIPLKEGWNMVGNPSVFRLNKTSLKTIIGTRTFPLGSHTENVFWGYDGVYKDENTLLPHYGYWIRAVSPCNLLFPYTEWDDGEDIGIGMSPLSLKGWSVKIEGGGDSLEFGVDCRASDGFDFGIDLSKPPMVLDGGLYLSFLNKGTHLAKDIRKEGDDITWDISVFTKEPLSLSFKGIERIDKEYQVLLIDSTNIIDLRKNNDYTVKSTSRLKIRLLKEGLIIQENKITKTIVYPNPSPGELTFYTAIKTKGASLGLTIYNIIGQKVYEGSLLPAYGKSWGDRFSREEQAYIYESSYSGLGSHNLPLAQGLYIYEIKSYALGSEDKAYGRLLIKR